jgi:hypothetical protein
MIRAHIAALVLVAALTALACLSVKQHRETHGLQLVEARMPIIAPVRSAPCNVPPYSPPPVRIV